MANGSEIGRERERHGDGERDRARWSGRDGERGMRERKMQIERERRRESDRQSLKGTWGIWGRVT